MSEEMSENRINRLRKAIAVLEAKRDEFGSDIVDMAAAPLRDELKKIGEGESRKLRKYVTVLFADISDFTKICESHDAEYVTEALNYLWSALDSIIIRHGGVIDKHIGDAVMALWGTETVRENDTERAIKSALEMQASAENILPDKEKGIPKFRMRIGVHSGPVFLGKVGLKGEYTAMGDTVNLASRLQSSAPLGSVVISREAYRNVSGTFLFQSRDPVKLKGIASPLKTYIAVSVNPEGIRQINTGIPGLETEMIGRDKELRTLIDTMNRTMLERTPRMVTIIGEAGIGKSRLLHEFRKRIERENEDMVFFNARCTPEMRNTPCSVFRDILKYRMNVMETDSTEAAWRKLKTGMGQYLTENEIHTACYYAGFDFSESEPVKKLLGTTALADIGQSSLINYFRSIAAENRTLVYLEDLHWADNTSLETIERLAADTSDARLLILSLSRPSLMETHPEWGVGLPHTFVELKPLSGKFIGDLIKEILRNAQDLPSAVTDLILSNSDGNPFYVEELIAMLVENGVIIREEDKWTTEPDAIIAKTIPSTLTGVLQARLDSLPPGQKEMLQKASVIGRLFWDRAVESLYGNNTDIDSMLSFAESRDLIYENSDSTFANTREYLFKHAILRDVTYDTVLLELRKAYHRNIAEWLVNNCGDRTREFSGLIAEHFDRGADRENAVHWLSVSGRSAYQTSSYAEALTAFLRCLDMVPETSPDLSQLHFYAGSTLEKLSRYDDALEHLERALRIADERKEHDIAARSLLALTWIASLRGEPDLSKELGFKAFERAKISGDRSILARAVMRMADFEEERNYDNIISYYKKSYEIYNELNDINGIAITLLDMGNESLTFDRPEEAEGFYRKSLKAYESLGNQWGIANCLGNLGNISMLKEDYNASRKLHEESLAISRRIGDCEGAVICNLNLGQDTRKLGYREESVKHYTAALRTSISLGLVPLALSVLLEIADDLIEDNKPGPASSAICYIMKYKHLLVEDRSNDLEEMIDRIHAKYPQWNKKGVSAESFSLQEISETVLEAILITS